MVALHLCCWLGVGWLAQYILVHIGLYLPLSIMVLCVILGIGGGYLGWFWEFPIGHQQLRLTILIFIGMSFLVAVLWQLDRVSTNIITGSNRPIITDIPGVHLEASGGDIRFHQVSNPPSYWLITIIYGFLVTGVGKWLSKIRIK